MGLRQLNQKIWTRVHRIPRARHLSMLVVAALALTLSACDWTEFGYVTSGGRSSPDTGISLSTVANMGTFWTATTGGGVCVPRSCTPVNSSPAVANGVVYVGSFDHKVYALNATTGTTRLDVHHRWSD